MLLLSFALLLIHAMEGLALSGCYRPSSARCECGLSPLECTPPLVLTSICAQECDTRQYSCRNHCLHTLNEAESCSKCESEALQSLSEAPGASCANAVQLAWLEEQREATFSYLIQSTAASAGTETYAPAMCAGSFFSGTGTVFWLKLKGKTLSNGSASHTLRVSTCDPEGFDTDLSVFSGPCEQLQQIACNGDAWSSSSECQARHSEVHLDLPSEPTYIVVGGYNGIFGRVNLSVAVEPEPKVQGARCQLPKPIGAVGNQSWMAVAPRLFNFAPNFGLPYSSFCSGARSTFGGRGEAFWFELTDIRDQLLEIHTCDSEGYDTDLSAYVGSSCGNLTMVACNGDADDPLSVPSCQTGFSALTIKPASLLASNSGSRIFVLLSSRTGHASLSNVVTANYMGASPIPPPPASPPSTPAPSPPAAPSAPPWPPLPPLAPGDRLIRGTSELVSTLREVEEKCSGSGESLRLVIPAGSELFLDERISLNCTNASIASEGEGATFSHAEGSASSGFMVNQRSRLEFRNIHFKQGNPESGLLTATGEASFLLKQCSFEQFSSSSGYIELAGGSQLVMESSLVSGGLATRSYSCGFMMIRASATALLRGVNATDCHAAYGGVLRLTDHGSLVLYDCSFTRCSAISGGALLIGTSCRALLTGCSFSWCQTSTSGGAIRAMSAYLTIESCVFTSNRAATKGGHLSLKCPAFSSVLGTFKISRCSFVLGLSDEDGGGLHFAEGMTQLQVARCLFTGCSAGGNGGSICVVHADCRIYFCLMLNSSAADQGGAMLFVGGVDESLMSDSRVAHSQAVVCGGGMALLRKSLQMSILRSSFEACSASSHGGAISMGYWSYLQMSHVLLANVSAPQGSAMCLKGQAAASCVYIRIESECVNQSTLFFLEDPTEEALHFRGVSLSSRCEAQAVINGGHAFPSCSLADTCGPAASCEELPLHPRMAMTSAGCSCIEPFYPSPTSADNSTAPYIEGCVSPPRGESVSTLEEGLTRAIHKSGKSSPEQMSYFGISALGTDKRSDATARWNARVEGSEASWLSLDTSEGLLPAVGVKVGVRLLSKGLRERVSTYDAIIKVYVAAPVDSKYDMEYELPVRLYVSAEVVASTSTWGRALSRAVSCADVGRNATLSEHLLLGSNHASLPTVLSSLHFQACDVDDLPVAHELPSDRDDRRFEVRMRSTASGVSYLLPSPEYVGHGSYAPRVLVETLGLYKLSLSLVSSHSSDRVAHVSPSLHATCAPPFITVASRCGCSAGFLPDERASCTPCPSFTSSAPGSPSCDVCAVGRYRLEPNVPASPETCVLCPPHVDCEWNSTLATWQLHAAYWRVSSRSTTLYSCTHSRNRTHSCKGGMHAGRDGDGYCAQGYRGPLCEICDDSNLYFRGGECKSCHSLSYTIGIALVSALVILVATCAIASIRRSDHLWKTLSRRLHRLRGPSSPCISPAIPSPRHSVHEGTAICFLRVCKQKGGALLNFMHTVGFLAKLKLCIVFYQVMLSIPSVYSVTVPDEWYERLEVFTWLNFDLFDLYHPTCIGGVRAQLHVAGLGSLAIVVSLLVLGGIAHRRTRSQGLQRNMGACLLAGLPLALFAVFALVGSVSRTIFRVWSCMWFQRDHADRSTIEFLEMEKSVVCGSEEHSSIKSLALLYVILWPILIPILFLALILPCRKAIRLGGSTTLVTATRPLHYEYRRDLYFWEIISLYHRLLLCGYASLIPNVYGIVRIVCGMCVSIIYCGLLMTSRPYERSDVNSLAVASNLVITAGFVTALLIKVHDDFSEQWSEAGASSVLGYDTTTDLAIVMGALCFFFLLFILAAMFHATKPAAIPLERHQSAMAELHTIQAAYDELSPIKRQPTFSHLTRSARQSFHSNAPTPSKLRRSRPGDAIRARLALFEWGPDREVARHARLLTIAARIRNREYGLRQYFIDLVFCFPELDLYLLSETETDSLSKQPPGERDESRVARHLAILAEGELPPEHRSTSGNSSAEEYMRTICALFGVYWLMRLDLPHVSGTEGLDGRRGFCFGVEIDSWVPLFGAGDDTSGAKRESFYCKHEWSGFHQLLVDCKMLLPQDDGSVRVNIERTAAMLTLTAIHDVMKLPQLLPKVLAEHAPYHGYEADVEIGDHDIALGYVLEHDPSAIPCYNRLEEAQRAPVRFTQTKIGFNHGWLVQAEAPPGALFNSFKSVIEESEVDHSMIAFYFVHWLTDLGGAVPTPLRGMEKFVVHFPLSVLASFVRSFPLVQRLASRSQSALMEEFLHEWWPSELGPIPSGVGSIAKMRLVVQAQSKPMMKEVALSFDSLNPTERTILESEMARTGIYGQLYRSSPHDGGPAFLVYYSPAFLRESVDSVHLALSVLAEVYQAARCLYPLSMEPREVGRSVTIMIDQLKGCGDAKTVIERCAEGFSWVLRKRNEQEAVVECVNAQDFRELITNTDSERPAFHTLHLWSLKHFPVDADPGHHTQPPSSRALSASTESSPHIKPPNKGLLYPKGRLKIQRVNSM